MSLLGMGRREERRLVTELPAETLGFLVDFGLAAAALGFFLLSFALFILKELARFAFFLLFLFSSGSASLFFLSPLFCFDLRFEACCLGINLPLRSRI